MNSCSKCGGPLDTAGLCMSSCQSLIVCGDSGELTDRDLLEVEQYKNLRYERYVDKLHDLLRQAEEVLGDFANPDEGEEAVYVGDKTSDEIAALWSAVREELTGVRSRAKSDRIEVSYLKPIND